ncbi:MAG: hypothetical protein GXO50_02740, partial [Chlorobi bacterium]|nr:hypothetical protein [Chlorobiota bacterium]
MKKIFIGLILILSNCSENKNQKIEEEFYQTFGKEKSEIIDEIVNYGSSLLMQAYNSDTKEQAYKAFVSDLQKTRPDSLELNFTKNQTDSFLNLFEKEKIKYDIFKFREENGIEKYIFDTDGKFMSVLNKVKETDKLAYDYYVSYNDTGQLP